MFCSQCGKQLDSTAKFCWGCGVAVPGVNSGESSAINTVDANATSFLRNLLNGDFGLAKTYWVYGVLVGIVVNIAANFVTSDAGLLALMLAHTTYAVPVIVGIWKAANKYQGNKIYVILAKMATIFGSVILAMNLFIAVNLLLSQEGSGIEWEIDKLRAERAQRPQIYRPQ